MTDQPLPNPPPPIEIEPFVPPRLSLPTYEPWLTKAILLFNLVLFILLALFAQNGLLTALMSGADPLTLVQFGAKVNILIVEGEYWRLLTPIFLHIGVVHLMFNQYVLHIFGREMESLFGTPRFAILYFLSGMYGSLFSFAFSPAISAGASGAIFGIIGGMVAFLLRNRETLGQRGRESIRGLLTMIGLNIVLGIVIPGIDNFGHLGGLVSGFILGFLLSPTYSIEALPHPPFAHIVENRLLLPMGAVVLVALALLVVGVRIGMGIAPI